LLQQLLKVAGSPRIEVDSLRIYDDGQRRDAICAKTRRTYEAIFDLDNLCAAPLKTSKGNGWGPGLPHSHSVSRVE
jgi:hypothetical protein